MASEKIVLITGANQGLGFETAKCLLSSDNYHIILGCRDLAKGEAAAKTLKSHTGFKDNVTPVQIDVTDPKSVEAAAAKVESDHGYLDVLVNNAGVYSQKKPSRDAVQDSMAVNVVGAVSATDVFLPLLRKSSAPARVVFVSSSMGSLTHSSNPKSHHFGPYADEYRASKAAVNMIMVQYSVKLGMAGMKVLGVDPGFCATNLAGDPESLKQMGAIEPEIGAQVIASVVKGERDADVGKVCCNDGFAPW